MYIQKRVRDHLATKFSKIEILVNYWDKMINELARKSEKMMDY